MISSDDVKAYGDVTFDEMKPRTRRFDYGRLVGRLIMLGSILTTVTAIIATVDALV
jgi:hypothetical protein